MTLSMMNLICQCLDWPVSGDMTLSTHTCTHGDDLDHTYLHPELTLSTHTCALEMTFIIYTRGHRDDLDHTYLCPWRWPWVSFSSPSSCALWWQRAPSVHWRLPGYTPPARYPHKYRLWNRLRENGFDIYVHGHDTRLTNEVRCKIWRIILPKCLVCFVLGFFRVKIKSRCVAIKCLISKPNQPMINYKQS